LKEKTKEEGDEAEDGKAEWFRRGCEGTYCSKKGFGCRSERQPLKRMKRKRKGQLFFLFLLLFEVSFHVHVSLSHTCACTHSLSLSPSHFNFCSFFWPTL
jgi:hypothetical protein